MMLLSAIDAVAVEQDGALWVDRQALRDELYALSGFSGVTGTLACDAFGDCGSQAVAIFYHVDSASEDALTDATVCAKSTLDAGFEILASCP